MLHSNFISLLIVLVLVKECFPYIHYTQFRMRTLTIQLEKELIMDISSKIRSIKHLREQYYTTIEYQIGERIILVNQLYIAMVKEYAAAVEDIDKNTLFKTTLHLKKVQEIQIHVNHLVQMINRVRDPTDVYEYRHPNNTLVVLGREGQDKEPDEETSYEEKMRKFEEQRRLTLFYEQRKQLYEKRKSLHDRRHPSTRKPDRYENGFDSAFY